MNTLHTFVFAMILELMASTALASQSREYDFRVWLDDREIGHHNFVVSHNNVETRIISSARFAVKFWFITAYSYLHTSHEIWQGDCLQSIQATTDDNGEYLFVQGTINDQSLLLKTHAGKQQLQGCIRTFAYWNPLLLKNTKLLNAQTGELETVAFELMGKTTINIREQIVAALHYQIQTPKFIIDLWYSSDHEWLALESTTESGARLRYQAM